MSLLMTDLALAPAADDTVDLVTGRVLLIDDDHSLLRAYCRILSEQGWAVTALSDPMQAKELLSKQPMDVVVSDISMPGVNGLALLAELRSAHPWVPFIVMTGNPHLESS